MTTTLATRAPQAAARLDYTLLCRGFLAVALGLTFVAPFSPSPVEFAVGAFVPWVILCIVGSPTLPAAVAFFLIWQWVQIFARAVICIVDGEAMDRGLYGPTVLNAYWYMLAGLVALAVAIRLVLSSLRPPTPRQAVAHLEWRPVDLFQAYLASLIIVMGARVVGESVSALDQPMEALARFKVVTLFVLFANVMSSGKGVPFLAAAVLAEVAIGFSGILGEFRGVFFVLAMAALASRIRWNGTTTVITCVSAVMLVGLALFWTSVKSDFRELATASDDSQNIKASIDVRYGYLGSRLASPGEIDWRFASYALLSRLAYVDIFGSVIGVKLVSPEAGSLRQWGDAVAHVFQPRFLFPGKAILSDTEVFVRLARGNSTEQMRTATSISVGYMAENYVDLDFPALLFGMFAIGLAIAGVCRYFMTLDLPWMVREGLAMAYFYALGSNGVEISLPKLLGVTVMFFLVYAPLVKFAFPIAFRMLNTRAAAAKRLELVRQQAKA